MTCCAQFCDIDTNKPTRWPGAGSVLCWRGGRKQTLPSCRGGEDEVLHDRVRPLPAGPIQGRAGRILLQPQDLQPRRYRQTHSATTRGLQPSSSRIRPATPDSAETPPLQPGRIPLHAAASSPGRPPGRHGNHPPHHHGNPLRSPWQPPSPAARPPPSPLPWPRPSSGGRGSRGASPGRAGGDAAEVTRGAVVPGRSALSPCPHHGSRSAPPRRHVRARQRRRLREPAQEVQARLPGRAER